MRIGIACPGPSLVSPLHLLEPCDFIVAINRSIERVDADYWCFGDYQTFGLFNIPKGRDPILFVGPCVMNHIRKEPVWPAFNHRRRLEWDAVPGAPANGQWQTFSATAALILAWHLGAERIDVVGSDMHGCDDFTGDPSEGRDVQRWELERSIWHPTVDWLTRQGIVVVRH